MNTQTYIYIAIALAIVGVIGYLVYKNWNKIDKEFSQEKSSGSGKYKQAGNYRQCGTGEKYMQCGNGGNYSQCGGSYKQGAFDAYGGDANSAASIPQVKPSPCDSGRCSAYGNKANVYSDCAPVAPTVGHSAYQKIPHNCPKFLGSSPSAIPSVSPWVKDAYGPSNNTREAHDDSNKLKNVNHVFNDTHHLYLEPNSDIGIGIGSKDSYRLPGNFQDGMFQNNEY